MLYFLWLYRNRKSLYLLIERLIMNILYIDGEQPGLSLNYISSPAIQDWVYNTLWGMHWTYSSLGTREEPLSKHGGETNPLRNSLVAAEPSFMSRQRCANDLQCFSLCLRIVQQCDSDGAPEIFSDIQRHTWYPAHPTEEGGCAHSLGTQSLSSSLLSFSFPLFLSDVLCPVPPGKGRDNGADFCWFIAVVLPMPTAI